MKYFVKTNFHGWVEVSKERFYGFCELLRKSTPAIPSDKKEEYIASRTKIVEA